MSSYDIAISMNETSVDRILSSLYGKPGIRNTIFKGTKTSTVMDVEVILGWDVLSPPTVSLYPPSPQQWKAAVKGDGDAPAPVTNAFLVNFPKVQVSKKSTSGSADSTDKRIQAICTAKMQSGQLSIDAQAVIVDLAGASDLDSAIYRLVLIPQVLKVADSLFSDKQIPDVGYDGVSFGEPSIAVGSGRLVGVANLSGKSAPAAPDTASLPNGNFYVLLSRDAMAQIANNGVAGLRGKSASTSGSKGFGLGDAKYDASVRLVTISVRLSDGNLTTIPADVQIQASASAGVDLFGGVINHVTDAAKTAAKGVEDAGKAIGDAFKSY